MRKPLVVVFIAFSIFHTSCDQKEDETNETVETKQTEDTDEDTPGKSVNQFNDEIVEHADIGNLHMAKLMDLDNQDVSSEEMTMAANEAISDITERINLLNSSKPVGYGGDEFLASAVDHLENVKAVAQVYIDFSDILMIPDGEWTEEMGTKWANLAEPIFADYEDSFEQLEIAQGNYASLNDKDIVPSGETLEELYEETK